MNFKVKNNWHSCKTKNFKKFFEYKKKPKAEKNYNIKGKYHRSFYECPSCNHFFAFHNFKTNNLYEKDYLNLTYKNEKGISKRFNQIINLPINKSDNKNRALRVNNFIRKRSKILDIGCGTGVFLHEIKKKGHEVIGLDLDVRYKNFLKKKNIKVITKKLSKFRTKKRFDFISFNKVLEHVSDPLQSLKESKRLLKQDGVIYIEVPDVMAKLKGKFAGEFCLDHLQIFSISSLDNLIRSAGLLTIKIKRIIEPSNKYTIFGFFKKLDK